MAEINPRQVIRRVLEMAHKSQSPHVGCALSVVGILSDLFNKITPGKDRVILSKGHGVMALYACLEALGYISSNALDEYLQDGTHLFGECEDSVPGIEANTGSLGHGLPIAVGIAFGLKRLGLPGRVYCVCGDGEMNEGSNFEAILFASHHKLDNLEVIIDANGFQAMGKTEDILDMASAFDWMESLKHPMVRVVNTSKGLSIRPSVHTNEWHYSKLGDAQYLQAVQEMES